MLASLSARRSRVQIPPGALAGQRRHGTQTGKATRLKPGGPVGSSPTRATRGWISRVVLLTAACRAVAIRIVRRRAEGSTPSPPTGGSLLTVRSSIGTGHQPLKLERRVRFPHGPLDDSPGGGTGRRAGLRSTCPRGVGVRISPWRLIGRCCMAISQARQVPGRLS